MCRQSVVLLEPSMVRDYYAPATRSMFRTEQPPASPQRAGYDRTVLAIFTIAVLIIIVLVLGIGGLL
jgi:hypothetical protein